MSLSMRHKEILACLEEKAGFAVATVMKSSGSTPRTSGTRMLVRQDGSIIGTIGGGQIEARVIKACLELTEQKTSRIQRFILNAEHKDDLDMICGGDMTVMMESIHYSPSLYKLFEWLLQQVSKGEQPLLVSRVIGNTQTDFTLKKSVCIHGKVAAGDPLPESLLSVLRSRRFSGRVPLIHNQGLEEFVIEPVVKRDTLFIFGAGHVGFKLAQMAHLVEFNTVVTDDRKEFANPERFPDSDTIRVVDHFSQSFDGLSIDPSSYIVILTRGHLHDQTVLEKALATKPAYIGMIGSRTKRDAIYANLMEKGVSKQRLDAVYSPIGLDIHSETPAEIAVSIIGQIIQVRAETGNQTGRTQISP